MQCSKCRADTVVFQPYSGQHLCREHFILDFEAKAKRTIRQHQWMQPGDCIAVALTGNSADNALLFFFQKLTAKRRDIRVTGIPVAKKTPDLMAAACDAGATRIALATGLEATAASMLADILRGDVGNSIRNGTTSVPLEVISPFCHIPAGEIATYARINGIEGSISSIMQDDDPLLMDVNIMLAGYTQRHPGAPHAILNLCHTIGQSVRHDRNI